MTSQTDSQTLPLGTSSNPKEHSPSSSSLREKFLTDSEQLNAHSASSAPITSVHQKQEQQQQQTEPFQQQKSLPQPCDTSSVLSEGGGTGVISPINYSISSDINIMKHSRMSYEDLDDLHFDILDELEKSENENRHTKQKRRHHQNHRNSSNNGGGDSFMNQMEMNSFSSSGSLSSSQSSSSSSSLCCLQKFFRKFTSSSSSSSSPKKGGNAKWLSHFRVAVQKNRFQQNRWSTNLFKNMNLRFSRYHHAEYEQAELHQNAQNSISELRSKAAATASATSTSSDHTAHSSVSQNSKQIPSNSTSLRLKQVIAQSIILEEDIENIRDSVRQQHIIELLTSHSHNDSPKNNHANSSFQTSKANKLSNNNQSGKAAKNSIGGTNNQTRKSKFNSKSNNRSSYLQEEEAAAEEYPRKQLQTRSIQSNTLLIDCSTLADQDAELYQAAVYYKTVTEKIEQHLKNDSTVFASASTTIISQEHHLKSNEKPLHVFRENFIEFFVQEYGGNLQSLRETDIINSIADLKEFLTLFVVVVREYFKLDELVLHCPLADQFMTTDNWVNFLCTILFQDDSIYSIVYVSHTHFEKALQLQFFNSVKELVNSIQLAQFKVPEEFRLDATTIQVHKNKKIKQREKKSQIEHHSQNNTTLNTPNNLQQSHEQTPNESEESKQEYINNRQQQFEQPFLPAIEHFKKIAYYRSPLHKLKVIIRTQELIHESINAFYQQHGLDQREAHIDADTLVGIFGYILVKSCVYDVIAHCKIVENFATRSTLNSQSGYLLVTLMCCVQIIAYRQLEPLSSQ